MGTPETFSDQHVNSVLANERTYAAWIRTGLASFVTSLATDRLFAGQAPKYALIFIAFTLAVASALFFYIAAWRYKRVGTHLPAEIGAPVPLLMAISMALVLISLIVSGYLALKLIGESQWIQQSF